MKRFQTTILFTAMVLTSAACAGIRIDTDYDPDATFATRGTYDWLDSAEIAEELERISPFLDRRIRQAVDVNMEYRGYLRDVEGDVDYLVSALVVAPEGYDMSRCRGRSCGGLRFSVGVGIGHRYPYGFGYPWYGFHPLGLNPWGYTHAYRVGYGYSWLPLYSSPSSNLPGTLVIDIVDPGSGELMWRGWAEGALLDMPDTEEQQQFLDQIVAQILAEFPPLSESR